MKSKFFLPALPGESPDGDGYFGAFGGKFIPEALVAAVDEVAIEYERAKADPGFAAKLRATARPLRRPSERAHRNSQVRQARWRRQRVPQA